MAGDWFSDNFIPMLGNDLEMEDFIADVAKDYPPPKEGNSMQAPVPGADGLAAMTKQDLPPVPAPHYAPLPSVGGGGGRVQPNLLQAGAAGGVQPNTASDPLQTLAQLIMKGAQ